MKTYLKLALGAILALSLSFAQASALNGNLKLVGLGQVNIDEIAGTMDFIPDPNPTFSVEGTGDLAIFAGQLGKIRSADISGNVNSFFQVENGSSYFIFDLVTLALTADASGKHALASGNATFFDGVSFHYSVLTFNLSTQLIQPNSWSADIPEPTTLAMFGLGLIGLGFAKRKKA